MIDGFGHTVPGVRRRAGYLVSLGGTDQAEERAKEDEADGVSILSFAFRPPSPCHQNTVMGDA